MRYGFSILLIACSPATVCAQEAPVLLTDSPSGWQCGATGGGTPRWAWVNTPEDGLALKQSGIAPFPWCVKREQVMADGFVEVRFKPVGGENDRAGGVVWRWQDGDNYYVARANAMENNVSLYYTVGGRRHTIRYVDAPVANGIWHQLRVDFYRARITVSLDGKRYIDVNDAHIQKAGLAGVWTKSDSVTLFADYHAGSLTSGASAPRK